MIGEKIQDTEKALRNVMEGLVQEYVNKYGDEKKVRQYLSCLLDGNGDEANTILRQLLSTPEHR